MARLSTCKQCGKKITINEKKIYQGKSFCLDCYYQKSIDSEKYKNLISFINNIAIEQGITIPPLVYKQIKQYKQEYGFDYYGIEYTLWYIIDVLNQNINLKEYGIALVQYEYNNAENWYINKNNLLENVNDIDLKSNKKTIKSFEKNNSKFYKTLNLDKIIKERK